MTSVELTQAIIDSIAAEVVVYDRADKTLLWNKQFAEGYAEDCGRQPEPGMGVDEVTRARLVGRGEITAEEVDSVVRERLSFHRSGLESFEFNRGGRDLILRESPGPDGSLVVTLVDISPIKQAQRERDETSDLLQSILESQPVGLALYDNRDCLRFWEIGGGRVRTSALG